MARRQDRFASATRGIESIHSALLLFLYSVGLVVFMGAVLLLNG